MVFTEKSDAWALRCASTRGPAYVIGPPPASPLKPSIPSKANRHD